MDKISYTERFEVLMTPLEKSRKIQKEAQKLIFESGIDRILSAHSSVYYTGSYALELMVWPDIDIAISLLDDPFDKGSFLEIGRQIGLLENIVSMKFKDHCRFPVEPLPEGLYWNIRIANDFSDVPWKIDLWALSIQQIEDQRREMLEIQKKLNAANRELIISIKDSLINEQGRTPILSGYQIYKAVLFHGLTKRHEIIEYLIQNDVEV